MGIVESSAYGILGAAFFAGPFWRAVALAACATRLFRGAPAGIPDSTSCGHSCAGRFVRRGSSLLPSVEIPGRLPERGTGDWLRRATRSAHSTRIRSSLFLQRYEGSGVAKFVERRL